MATRRGLSWQTLATCTWLPQSVGSAARDVLDHQMALLGVEPRTVPVLTRVSTLTVSLVETLDVLALVPLSVVQPWVDAARLCVVDLKPALPFKPLGIVMPTTNATQAALTFVAFIEGFVAERAAATAPPASPVSPGPGRPRPSAEQVPSGWQDRSAQLEEAHQHRRGLRPQGLQAAHDDTAVQPAPGAGGRRDPDRRPRVARLHRLVQQHAVAHR